MTLCSYVSAYRSSIFWTVMLSIPICTVAYGATRWRSWLRHCATRRKIAGSIPDGVIGIFH